MAKKVSYGITCKGRLHHLSNTLPRNLAAERDDPDVEFVLLDYQSEDGMADHVRQTFAAEIAAGRIVYAHNREAPFFRMAHAKNMVARLSSGDILCNLDADNVLPAGYAGFLRERFAERRDITVSPRELSIRDFFMMRFVRRVLNLVRRPPGLSGRIAVTRENFYRLGGYNETFSAWGQDDADFQFRGRDAGIVPIVVPRRWWGDVLDHGNEERINNLSVMDREASAERLDSKVFAQAWEWIGKVRARHATYPNIDGEIGCGRVWLNFADEPTVLGPLPRPA